MRKIRYIMLFAALMPFMAQAQTDYYVTEAARFSQNHYEGTARTIAMGNAFTALGGDLGAITINPASSAVLRRSEFTFTAGITKSNYGISGATKYSSYDNIHIQSNNGHKNNCTIPNFGLSCNVNTGNYSGLLNYSFGIVVNRTNDFNRKIQASVLNFKGSSWLGAAAVSLNGISQEDIEKMPYFNNNYNIPASSLLAWDTYLIAPLPNSDNEYIASTENLGKNGVYIGGPLDQDFTSNSYGGTYQWALNFSGNFNDNLFIGANLNIHTIDYILNETYQEYASTTPNTFEDGFDGMSHTYSQYTSGSGISANFGIIYLLDNLRLGASISTPIKYSLSEREEQSMTASFTNGKRYSSNTDVRKYDYNLMSPMRYSIGIAYTFGRSGLISLDYEGADYGAITLYDHKWNSAAFSAENKQLSKLNMSHIWRLGAEVNISKNLSIRGGYNTYSKAGEWIPYSQTFAGGIGIKIGNHCNLDFAYQRTSSTLFSFTCYDNYDDFVAPNITTKNSQNKAVLTLGLKF